jgi:hypothetical protein
MITLSWTRHLLHEYLEFIFCFPKQKIFNGTSQVNELRTMEFDDLFENKHKYHGNYAEPGYYNKEIYSYDSYHTRHEHGNRIKWLNIMERIKQNKKLRFLFGIVGILVLAFVILLFLLFLPLIVKLFNVIHQNGFQGVFNDIIAFITKIWKGSGT